MLSFRNATGTDEGLIGLYLLVASNENSKCCIHDIYLQHQCPMSNLGSTNVNVPLFER